MNATIRRTEDELVAAYGRPLLDAQLVLEESMVSLGRDQIRKQIASAREKANEGGTSYGQKLIAHNIERMAESIVSFITKAKSGGAGRRHIAVKYLDQVEMDVASFIALRCVIDSLTGKRQVLQRVAVVIGSRIEDEARFTAFEMQQKATAAELKEAGAEKEAKAAAKVFGRAQQKAGKGTTYWRSKATLAGYERRFSEGEWEAWPEQDRLHIGMALIDMMVTLGLITIDDEVLSRKKTNKVVAPTEAMVSWVENEMRNSELLSPSYMPMIVPPLDWTTPYDGGYLTAEGQAGNMMIKTRNANYLTEMADKAHTMPMVYDSLNKLQRTRWAINRPVFEIMEKMWELGHATAGLPDKENIQSVACSCCGQAIGLADLNTRGSEEHGCFEDLEVLRQWKKDAHIAHNKNVSLGSKRMHLAKTVRIAGKLVGYDAIHFPYQLDFRGRIYCIPSFNPQGNDVTKGLLTFADGKAINDGVAAGWLAIQGANTFGFDKASLEDRIGWVEDNQELIIASAADPMSCSFWLDADAPWQFLAFCFEWAGFCEQGFGYVSRLPVALDGSCSGIQHFSAMLRDSVGGAAVNLIPADKPQDIYQRVCDKAVAKLKADAEALSSTIAIASLKISPSSDEEEEEAKEESYSLSIAEMAKGWLYLMPDRSSTKRQVMTLPYGSTRFSCREYTEAWMKEAIARRGSPWETEHNFQASAYMSGIIWDAISEVVIAAREAMDWLQECAAVVSTEKLPVYWTNPVGFTVMQIYKNTTARRVRTKIGDTIIKLSLTSETNEVDRRRMRNAISPNVVHSLDAAHLVSSVCTAADNGIDSFAMIHDSFGTHAADTNMLAACLREAFVQMYSETDVLDDLREQFKRQAPVGKEGDIPALPPKGDLDIEAVRNSDFFFA